MNKKNIDWDYTNLAKFYDFRANYDNKFLSSIINKKNKSLKVLEYGAGTGKLTKILIKYFEKIVALEPNLSMRDIGKKNLYKFKKNIQWISEKAEDANFNDNYFDLIFFGSSFNVINSKKILNKIGKVLKKNGIVYIIWNNRSFNNIHQKNIELIINKNIKKYEYGLRRSSPEDILKKSNLFKQIQYKKSLFNVKIKKKNFISAWKSHGTLYKQCTKKDFQIIIKNISKYVNSISDSEYINVPYYTNMWVCKKK